MTITTKALKQFLNDSINARLKSAIGGEVKDSVKIDVPEIQEEVAEDVSDKPKVQTTDEEVEGFNIVKAILRQKVEGQRVFSLDTQSYFGILLDDNNRKPICRLWFNTKQKHIGTFDESKTEIRHPIESVDDIFNFSEQLQNTLALYE